MPRQNRLHRPLQREIWNSKSGSVAARCCADWEEEGADTYGLEGLEWKGEKENVWQSGQKGRGEAAQNKDQEDDWLGAIL